MTSKGEKASLGGNEMSWNWRELNTFMNILFAHSEMGGMIDDTRPQKTGSAC